MSAEKPFDHGVITDSVKPIRIDKVPNLAKTMIDNMSKVLEKDGVKPRTQSAEQFMRGQSDRAKSNNASPETLSPRPERSQPLQDRLIVLETSSDPDEAPVSRRQAAQEAREIMEEWGSEYSDDLDMDALETALTKYPSDAIYGLVGYVSGYPSEMRTQWLNDRLAQLNKTADIPGMTELVDRLTDQFPVPTQQGTEFELDWIAAHASEIRSVGLETVERIDSDGQAKGLKQGVDVMLKDGTAVELKCYDFSRPTYQKGAGVEGPLRQVERDITQQGFSRVKLVFDTSFGEMPDAFRRRLKAGIDDLRARFPDVKIDYETWKRKY
jgi:hypothetical protein